MSYRAMLRTLLVITLLAVVITACVPKPTVWTDTKSDRWSDDAVFYEIFVRSFYDSDGDGIGDFNGLTEKLDYLNDGDPETTDDLGVTALWLMPIFPSPSYHGYDVTDYYAVNPQYGTMEDFKNLLAEAHKRGIYVTIDFVVNHTSDQHPWFQAAAAGDPQYEDYYIWSDTNPGYNGPWGQGVWHNLGGRFYYGVFVREMPDLNFKNPAVTEEIKSVAEFWLNEVGVDGFRVDGAKHLIEQGTAQENTPETHAWFKDFSEFYRGIKPEAAVVGEIWSPSEDAAAYVNNGELDLVFNFPLADEMLGAATFNDARRLSNSLLNQDRVYTSGRYAAFLTNHDQTRAMTKMVGDTRRAKSAATMLLTAPGTPFIYYGEEIGMTGDKPDANLRTPMQWSGGENAGFSSGTPWMNPSGDYMLRNVETMDADPDSLLSHYRRLIRVRSDHHALRTGDYVQVMASDNKIFASLRVAETVDGAVDEAVLVLVNLSKDPVSGATLKWSESALRGTYRPQVLLGEGKPASLTVGESGGIEGFAVLEEIPAETSLIIQYR